MPLSFRQPPTPNWHKTSWINCLFLCFYVVRSLKEDFLENLHVLSCFVQSKKVLLISCVFWISVQYHFFSHWFLEFNESQRNRYEGAKGSYRCYRHANFERPNQYFRFMHISEKFCSVRQVTHTYLSMPAIFKEELLLHFCMRTITDRSDDFLKMLTASSLDTWCFKPSQPQRIISRLLTQSFSLAETTAFPYAHASCQFLPRNCASAPQG